MNTYGNNFADGAVSVQPTEDGYLIFGSTYSDLDDQTNDIYIFDIDRKGNVRWEKSFGTSGDDFCQSTIATLDGGYIILAMIASSEGPFSVWLIKVDIQGNIEWDSVFGGKIGDFANEIQQTEDGGFIITGETKSSQGDSDVWLIKTNDQGVIEWDTTFGDSGYDSSMSVLETEDTGFLISATYKSEETYNDDVWLIKTDRNGTLEWDKKFNKTRQDDGVKIIQSKEGGYIILGTAFAFLGKTYYTWIIKTDISGNKVWDIVYESKNIHSVYDIIENEDSSYVVCGKMELSPAEENSDVWLFSIDRNGTILWERFYGGPLDEGVFDLRKTSDYGYVMAGYTLSYGAGDYDALIIKTDSNGLIDL